MDTETLPPPVVKSMLPAAGLHTGIPFEVYRGWKAANHSLLKHFDRSALHARHAIDNPKEMTEAMRMGHALHVATFEPARFVSEFIVIPEFHWTTQKQEALDYVGNLIGAPIADRKMKKDDALALVDGTGKTVLDAGQHADLVGMGDAIRGSRAASAFITAPGDCEVSCIWRDGSTGLDCKGRFDKLAQMKASEVIVELKSTRDARRWQFSSDCAQRFYSAQASHYRTGLALSAGRKALHVIIAVESTAPYGVAIYQLPDSAWQTGRIHNRTWLDRYAECLETDEWPGYPDKVELLDEPMWAQRNN